MGKVLLWLSERFYYLILITILAMVGLAYFYETPDQIVTRGEIVTFGTAEKPPIVKLSVDQAIVRKITPGQSVTLDLDVFPPDRYGLIKGEVSEVGVIPENNNETGGMMGVRYEVKVALTDIPEVLHNRLFPRLQGTVSLQLPDRSLLDKLLGRTPAELPTTPSTDPEPGSVSFESGVMSIISKAQTIDITVEIADTTERFKMGLMYRENLPENQGMLFVFPGLNMSTFYMLNTNFPLSIAFIDQDNKIISIQEMGVCKQEPCQRYRPDQPYVLALEMNREWFKTNGITVGDQVDVSRINLQKS